VQSAAQAIIEQATVGSSAHARTEIQAAATRQISWSPKEIGDSSVEGAPAARRHPSVRSPRRRAAREPPRTRERIQTTPTRDAL